MTNKEIVRLFRLGAKLLELYDENKFKIRAYEKAASNILQLPDELGAMSDDEIRDIEGIGGNIFKKIIQIKEHGIYDELSELIENTPDGILELLTIKGMGAKKVSVAWKKLDVDTPEKMFEAAGKGQLRNLSGFGIKTEDNIKTQLEYYLAHKGEAMYAKAEAVADDIKRYLEKQNGIKTVIFTGSLRRRCPLISQIDLLVVADPSTIDKFLIESPFVEKDNQGFKSVELKLPVKIHLANSRNWAGKLLETTGSEAFLSQFSEPMPEAASEEEIFKQLHSEYYPPEMREEEWVGVPFPAGRVKNLIAYEDIKGCLHNHTTHSDGEKSIKEMALRCKELGLEYFGIADHSRSAYYANGLSARRVFNQFEEIEQLNKELRPFKIFKGIESDILSDGSLDYEEDLLKEFDYIVSSIHSPLKMEKEKATQRLIRAIENPYTTILGHMTGRMLLIRQGYPVDHEKVIDACAANNVIIEINSNPRRLDIDWKYLDMAMEKGVQIAINPDAHSLKEIEFMRFGVYMARKGAVPKNMVLNAKSLKEVEAYFNKRKVTI